MTTEKTGATAQQPDAAKQSKGNDNGVTAAAAAASAEPTEVNLEERIDSVLSTRLNQYGQRVAEVERREQGRAQQWYGDKLKETRTQDQADLAGFMSDLTLVLDDEQREKFDDLRTNRENDNLRQRIQQLEDGPAQAPATEQVMSEADGRALRDATEAVIEVSGLTIGATDARLWQGYDVAMSLPDTIRLMRRNVKAISEVKPAPAVEGAPSTGGPPPTPTDRVPVSTNAAPKTPVNQYSTLGELAIAFRNREINSTQYASIAKEEGWL